MKIEAWMGKGIYEAMEWYDRGGCTKVDIERLLNDRAALPNGRGVTWIAPDFGHIDEVTDERLPTVAEEARTLL